MAFSGHWISTEIDEFRYVKNGMNWNTEEDGLLEPRLGKEASSIRSTTHSRNDLSSSTVNCISVQLPKQNHEQLHFQYMQAKIKNLQ